MTMKMKPVKVEVLTSRGRVVAERDEVGNVTMRVHLRTLPAGQACGEVSFPALDLAEVLMLAETMRRAAHAIVSIPVEQDG